ncbi:MAG: aminotransferase class I/II-fold pyridoxal phosphate-dependent enzyme [Planctomycetaceae bacterium]
MVRGSLHAEQVVFSGRTATGLAIAHPEHIEQMRKFSKDSYNCDGTFPCRRHSAIQDQQWMLDNTAKIRATRSRLTAQLRELGFENVGQSGKLLVWSTHTEHEHRRWRTTQTRKVLVRFMQVPRIKGRWLADYEGTDAEIDTADALQDIV